jgi:hypothetical protein
MQEFFPFSKIANICQSEQERKGRMYRMTTTWQIFARKNTQNFRAFDADLLQTFSIYFRVIVGFRLCENHFPICFQCCQQKRSSNIHDEYQLISLFHPISFTINFVCLSPLDLLYGKTFCGVMWVEYEEKVAKNM